MILFVVLSCNNDDDYSLYMNYKLTNSSETCNSFIISDDATILAGNNEIDNNFDARFGFAFTQNNYDLINQFLYSEINFQNNGTGSFLLIDNISEELFTYNHLLDRVIVEKNNENELQLILTDSGDEIEFCEYVVFRIVQPESDFEIELLTSFDCGNRNYQSAAQYYAENISSRSDTIGIFRVNHRSR